MRKLKSRNRFGASSPVSRVEERRKERGGIAGEGEKPAGFEVGLWGASRIACRAAPVRVRGEA